VAKRNWVNAIVLFGLSPLLLWLALIVVVLLDHDRLLPWVSAAIILAGAPCFLLSVFLALPAMIGARRFASVDPAVWSRIHRAPYFFGIGVFSMALILGIWIVIISNQASTQ
jgi:hypothetical protein